MSATLATQPAVHAPTGYLPRITARDGKVVETLLASGTLLETPVRPSGVVVEAAYAATEPPLLARLSEEGVHRLVDAAWPQTASSTSVIG